MTDVVRPEEATAGMAEWDGGPRASQARHDQARRLVRGLPDSRVAAALPALFAAFAVHYPFAPGLISADTNAILYEAQSGHFRDWYTPLGSGVFWLADHLGISHSILFWIQTLLVVGALYLLLRPPLRRLYAGIAAAVICLFPPLYAQLSNLSRDSFALAFTLLALGLLRHAITLRGVGRWACMALAIVSAVVAGLWRQNALLVVVGVVGAVVSLALLNGSLAPWLSRRRNGAASRWRPRLVALVAGCIFGAGVFFGSQAVYKASGVLETYPQRQLWVFDLAGISVRTNHNVFPSSLPRVVPNRPGVVPPNISEANLKRLYNPTNVLTLYPGGNWAIGLNNPKLDQRQESELFGPWLRSVLASPGSYLIDRLDMLSSQLGLTRRPVDAFDGLMQSANYGYPLEHPGDYRTAQSYLNIFVGPNSTIPLDVAWPYLLLATVSLIVIRKRVAKEEAVLLSWLVVITWAWVLVFGVVGVASSFRYSVLVVPVGLVLMVWAGSCTLRSRRRDSGLVEVGSPASAAQA